MAEAMLFRILFLGVSVLALDSTAEADTTVRSAGNLPTGDGRPVISVTFRKGECDDLLNILFTTMSRLFCGNA